MLCSFYVDFTSWNTGCETGGLLNIFGPDKSWSRNNPFPGGELKDMMEVSKMLQGNGRKDLSELHVAPGDGMPNMTNNKYNEVLIDSQYYQKALPGSVAAVFYVENGDPAGPECAEATHTALVQRYGLKDDDVLLLAHSQGATPAFSKPVAPERPAGRASNDPRLRRRQQQAEQAARENSGDGNPGA